MFARPERRNVGVVRFTDTVVSIPKRTMQLLDLRTIVVLTGMMSGLMALVVLSLKRTYPKSILGLGEWALALMLLFGGGFTAALRGYVPDSLGLTLPNLMLSAGIYLCYVGSQRFFRIQPRPVAWIVLIVGVSVVQIWFTYAQPSYQVRLIAINALMVALFAAHGLLFLKQGLTGFAKILLFAVMLFMSQISLARLVTAFVLQVGDGLMSDSPFQLVYVTSFSFSMLLFSIAVVLLATDRLRTELEHLASHDPLTSALTRRRMDEHCQQELQRCKRNGGSMALLVMDLDHFKAINDNHGHQMGDRVLADFAAKVHGLLRQPDQLGRLGGEEFLLLLPESNLADAQLVAERIRSATAQTVQGTPCTVSIGVTVNQGTNDTVDAMLARADRAMYRAKANGRNRVESD
jgi:diguanylate cyclase (GGDEF)-like protein